MSSNEYMRKYMLQRYRTRMDEAINRLGGECVECGSVENLQLDHIDPSQKSFTTAKGWSVSKDKFWKEVSKCQLLCQNCHTEKTLKENGQILAKGTHGSLSSYRYCKCEECKLAMSNWNKQYRLKRKMGLMPTGEAITF